MPFEKNENVVMTNVDSQLSEEDIDSARRLMKKRQKHKQWEKPDVVKLEILNMRDDDIQV